MTNPANQNNNDSSKTAFKVAASPFNPIKLELVIILIIGFVLWLVLDSITDNDLTHVAILFLYSASSAIWLTLRIRHIAQQKSNNWVICNTSGLSNIKMTTKKRNSRSKSSRQWLKDHFDDAYVKQAQKEGFRSRAAYKLLEIQQRDHILKHGMRVVDLGAAPGGWSQVATRLIGSSGQVIALDLLPVDPMAHMEFIQGDFTEQSVLDKLLQVLENKEVDLVMSDMAPNISGIKAVDQPRSMYLAELALDLAQNVLCKNGSFLIKVFQGAEFDNYIRLLRSSFEKVVTRKPKASRSNSREVYLLARGYHR